MIEIFADGVGSIAVSNGVARLELVQLRRNTVGEAKLAPQPVATLLLPVAGFQQLLQQLNEAAQKIQEQQTVRVKASMIEKDENTVTIVGLGDSIMFGHGVGDGEPYLAVLKRMLEAEFPQKQWRVINTGVPGYNTVMEVETLRTKCRQFDPDLVILELVGNDLALPIYIRVEQNVFDLTRSFLWQFVEETRNTRTLGRDPTLIHQESALANEQIPEEYRDLAGWNPFMRALRDLRRSHASPVCIRRRATR